MPGRYTIGLALVVGCCLAPLGKAGEVAVDYTFARPTISQIDIKGVTYDRITMPDAPSGGKAGQPKLPVGGARILIPYGEEVVGFEVTGEKMLLGSGYRIEPVGKPFPLSIGPTAENIPTPNAEIYASTVPFPAERFAHVGTYGFRGFEIAYLRLEPTEYVPATGELYYYPHLQVTVRTAATGRTNSLFRGFVGDARQAAQKVDNPAVVDTYPATRARDSRNYDLLIITTSSYADAFQALKDAHDLNGTPTQVHIMTSGATGEQIRAHIHDCYLSDGIQFALVGAGDAALHAPDLWTDDGFGGYAEMMPSDFYLGCLDGPYDPSGPPAPPDLDLVGEVYIGRAAADSVAEVNNFCNKTIAYMNEQHGHLNQDLQVGEQLGFGGVSEYATDTMEQLVDGGYFDGYTTTGIPSAQFDVARLYDDDGPPPTSWSVSQLINWMNSGVHWINHLGHANQTYNMKMYTSDVQALTNTDYFFVYSQGCDSGWFDGYECIAEYFTTKTAHGAFAVIMNARYGWGEFDSTDGPSQRFHRYFWDGAFDPDVDEKYYYGAANQYSHESNIPRLADDCTRYCFYETNLLGDPSLLIIGAERPLKIKLQSSLPAIVPPDVTTTITVQVDPGDEAYVPETAMLNYRVNDGAFEAAPLVLISGEMYQATLPATACDSTVEYYFSAQGTESGAVNLPKLAPTDLFRAYVATYVSYLDDDFQTETGWTVWNSPTLTTGAWGRGVPNGSGQTGAPPQDYDESGMCFVTDNRIGNFDVDGGQTILTSPTFDFTNTTNPMIQYSRWSYCDDHSAPQQDFMDVQLSNDSATWATVEHVSEQGAWVRQEIRVRDYVALTGMVQMRFMIADNPNNSITECGVDAVVIYDLYCAPPTGQPGDLNCDNAVNVFDIDPFVLALTDSAAYGAAFPTCDYMRADVNDDGVVNSFDIDPFVDLLTR